MIAEIVLAAEAGSKEVDAFLNGIFPEDKRRFLREYGDWWHGGGENRWLLQVDGTTAGYCAVIPTRVVFDGQQKSALWWVDLVIAPDFRGQRLQRLFDEKIRTTADLTLGFPNKLAAAIHRKHGWVVREDFKVRLCPLQPVQMPNVRNREGAAGMALKVAAMGLSPLAWLLRQFYLAYRPGSAREMQNPSPEILAGIFERHAPPEIWTTARTPDYFRWRFLEAPYRHQLKFYLAGPEGKPTQYLVARHLERGGKRVVRILDAFGDFGDVDDRTDVIRLCLKTAVAWGAVQVTVLDSLPAINLVFSRAGFVVHATARFCAHTEDAGTMIRLKKPGYWTLADSDNDSPG